MVGKCIQLLAYSWLVIIYNTVIMLNMNLKHLLLNKAAILTPILQYLSEYRQQAQVFIIVLFFANKKVV